MKALYYDALWYEEVEKELGAREVGLEELLRESDYVSINLQMVPSTKGLIGEKELEMMKTSAYIINLAREPIWDEEIFYEALKYGKIVGVGPDVYEVEPTSKTNPLFKLDNFFGTNNMAAHTEEALKRMSMVAEDVLKVLEGKLPLHPVNEPKSSRR